MNSCAIIGNGRLGHGLAYALIHCGWKPHLIGRNGFVKSKGIFEVGGALLPYDLGTPQNVEDLRIIFVVVKAYEVETALRSHLHRLPRAPIVFLSNGYLEPTLRNLHLKYRNSVFRLGASFFAVSRREGRFLIVTPQGRFLWGPFIGQREESFAEKQLRAVGHGRFDWSEVPEAHHRKKWLFNTVINSICGAKRYERNRYVLRDPAYFEEVFSEVFEAGRELWGEWEAEKEVMLAQCETLVRETGENQNSMVADIKSGKRTEREFLSGACRRPGGVLKELDERLQASEFRYFNSEKRPPAKNLEAEMH